MPPESLSLAGNACASLACGRLDGRRMMKLYRGQRLLTITAKLTAYPYTPSAGQA